MPWGAMGINRILCDTEKDFVSVDNLCAGVLLPKLCLSGFTDAGRPGKYQTAFSVVYKCAMQKDGLEETQPGIHRGQQRYAAGVKVLRVYCYFAPIHIGKSHFSGQNR